MARRGARRPGRVRGRRPWASGGGAVTGGSVWRLGLAAALRSGGGSVPLGRRAARSRSWSRLRRSLGRRRSAGSDSRAGFAARARTAGVCGSFYDGPAVAADPVARRRPTPGRGAGGGAVGVGAGAESALASEGSQSDRTALRLFVRSPGRCGRPRSSARPAPWAGPPGAVTGGAGRSHAARAPDG
jgi:hypothetical protein